jgi:beta-glucosidase/6-phospho-beta-glucosidase/beta-galactosidase
MIQSYLHLLIQSAQQLTSPESGSDRFARYCERLTLHLGDLIGAVCAMNEPNLPTLLAAPGIGSQPSSAARRVLKKSGASALCTG